MEKELTLLPICAAEDSKKQKAEAQYRRMAAALDEAYKEEARRRERWDRIFDCFMMGAAGAMTACVLITMCWLA